MPRPDAQVGKPYKRQNIIAYKLETKQIENELFEILGPIL